MTTWMRQTSTMILLFALIAGGCSTTKQAADEIEDQGEAAADAVGIPEGDESLVGAAHDEGDFNTLVKVIQETNLTDQLRNDGPYTIFAPTDDAFNKMSDAEREAMMQDSNREELRALILNHTVEGRVSAEDLQDMRSVETVYGNTLRVQRRGGNLYVGGAQVVEAGIEADNGIIHAVNKVIR